MSWALKTQQIFPLNKNSYEISYYGAYVVIDFNLLVLRHRPKFKLYGFRNYQQISFLIRSKLMLLCDCVSDYRLDQGRHTYNTQHVLFSLLLLL